MEGYMRLAQTFFLIVALSDLHQAMIHRAKLSVATGITSEKPGYIADMHFRKMALLFSIADQAMVWNPRSRWSDQMFADLLVHVINVIGAQKQALDALVVIPVTRVIRGQILAFEQGSVVTQRTEKGKPWLGRLGVLFGDELAAATFKEETLPEILGA
jgi:hypothetical protein